MNGIMQIAEHHIHSLSLDMRMKGLTLKNPSLDTDIFLHLHLTEVVMMMYILLLGYISQLFS